MLKIISHCIAIAMIMLFQLTNISSFACSVCKVTINGRTFLGNNEDSWRMGSRIWFETQTAGRLGVLYVGYGNNYPQGGMNEAGLAFDGLTISPKPIKLDASKKTISQPLNFLKEIMQTCKTVEDVRKYAIQYNRQPMLNNGEYFFADKLGNYLVMESDTMIIGNDDKYIIANFCPSITPRVERLKWDRYRRGDLFLSNNMNHMNESYCLDLVDTMHECRGKLGDGTMYSFVADLDKSDFTLYFYHDYKHAVKFNLNAELAKGDHLLDMPTLFPANVEFQRLINYKIPQNNVWILAFFYLCAGLFTFSSLFFAFSALRNSKHTPEIRKYTGVKLLIVFLSAILLYYLFALFQNPTIFYFPAPYRDYQFSILNIVAYIPILMALLIVPLLRINLAVIKGRSWHIISKFLFSANNLAYLGLIALFGYWGFYNIL
ncbi:MAG TPA: hypothetical protein VK666_02840 [Chryseolinea sp.]|nr:hypothetical protein [Chryseolinea sp.]